MAGGYASVAESAQLAQLLMIVDVFPRFLRASQERVLRGLRQRIEAVLGKQWQTLEKALNDPGHDRHQVRLLIKRVRYGAKACRAGSLTCRSDGALERGAKGVGEWRRLAVVAASRTTPDLQPCVEQWRATLARGEKRGRPGTDQVKRGLFSRLGPFGR